MTVFKFRCVTLNNKINKRQYKHFSQTQLKLKLQPALVHVSIRKESSSGNYTKLLKNVNFLCFRYPSVSDVF